MKSNNGQFMSEQPDIMKSLTQFYMVTRTDGDGSIIFTNKNFLETSKWTPRRILGKMFWQMFPDTKEDQEQAYLIWSHIKGGKTWFGNAKKSTRLGESYFVNLIGIPLITEDAQLESVTFLELDITADIHLRDKLQQIAFIDYESGLMSRFKLESTVDEYISNKRHFSFVYLTIDHYYTLKELQFHDSENELIKSFTNRLKRFFLDNPIARIGVNEFVILTPFGDWFIQGFIQFLKQQPIYLGGTALPLSVSGGIVRFPEDQQTYTHLMKAALSATKEGIDNGGGKIVSLSAASHQVLNRRAIIDHKLLTALNRNDLQVVYQPQFDIKSDEVTLFEAFVRWNDDELGYVMPDELIPIAEENGLIHEIGAFVLEEAATLAADWNARKRPVKVAINSSAREFTNPSMKESVLDILEKTECPATYIQLEITEKFAFQAEEEKSISIQMKELQDEGVEFVLDDFGTGFASFRYMQHLPISKIKIDKLFIQSLLTQPKTQQLVDGMIQFGKSMSMYVVAEGVETKEQFDILKKMGVDAVQGYYIGAPVTAEDISI